MTLLNDWLLENTFVPWRLRSSISKWLYASGKDRVPWLFRLVSVGRLRSIARPVTIGPFHHFFGYYDKTPWSSDETKLLCHRVGFMDRPPTAKDEVDLGIVDLKNGGWHKIASTHAWNWQQGAMLRWHPTQNDTVLFNDRQGGRFVTRFLRWKTGEMDLIERPLYAISSDGCFGFSVNFARLQKKRPGYGYAGVDDPWEKEFAPKKDGIWRVDFPTGQSKLIVPLAELAGRDTKPTMKGVPHWVNHIQISPQGKKILFLHRWGNATAAGGFISRLYCASPNGDRLRCILDNGDVSHYDWLDDERLIVWAQHPSSGKKFYLIHIHSGEIQVVGDGCLTQDGHCNFSPDKRFIVTDTYADKHDLRTLILFKLSDQKRIDLELLRSPRNTPAEIRCDFHPRWSPSGTHLCIDSLHEGTRQMYILDVRRYLN